jgi:SAM-dependent methyltransferase
VDNAPDMLALCRRKAAQRGLVPGLHQQDVQRLALPCRYATVFCAYGIFQLLTDWDEALATHQRIYEHLTPDGRFLVALWMPWHALTAPRRQWRLTKVVTRSDDGATVLRHEASDVDALRQVQTVWMRHAVYQRDQLATTGLRRMRLRWYGRREFQLMLATAGFRDVTITDDQFINRSYYVALRPAAAG